MHFHHEKRLWRSCPWRKKKKKLSLYILTEHALSLRLSLQRMQTRTVRSNEAPTAGHQGRVTAHGLPVCAQHLKMGELASASKAHRIQTSSNRKSWLSPFNRRCWTIAASSSQLLHHTSKALPLCFAMM